MLSHNHFLLRSFEGKKFCSIKSGIVKVYFFILLFLRGLGKFFHFSLKFLFFLENFFKDFQKVGTNERPAVIFLCLHTCIVSFNITPPSKAFENLKMGMLDSFSCFFLNSFCWVFFLRDYRAKSEMKISMS